MAFAYSLASSKASDTFAVNTGSEQSGTLSFASRPFALDMIQLNSIRRH